MNQYKNLGAFNIKTGEIEKSCIRCNKPFSLEQKCNFDFVRPFDLMPNYKDFCESRPSSTGGANSIAAPAARLPAEASAQAGSEPSFSSKNPESIVWSGHSDSNRESRAPKARMLTITPCPGKCWMNATITLFPCLFSILNQFKTKYNKIPNLKIRDFII